MEVSYTDECIHQIQTMESAGFFNKGITGGRCLKIKEYYPAVYKKMIELKEQFNMKNSGEALYWIRNRITEYPHCQYHSHPKCDDHPLFYTFDVGYRKGCKYCGRANPEITQKQKDGLKAKYGVENIMLLKEFKDKRNNIMIEKHGGFGWGSKDIREKFENTMLERYGVKNAVDNPELLQKSISRQLERYSDPENKKRIIDQKHNTEIERYGTIYTRLDECQAKRSVTFNNSEKYKEYCKQKNEYLLSKNILLLEPILWEQDAYKWKCLVCNTEYTEDKDKITLSGIRNGKVYWCPKCYKHSGQSSNSEWDVGYFISSQIPNIKIEHNRRDLIPNNYKEIDLWFPDYKIGIEFCGMIYHATFPYGLNGKGLSEKYHQEKFYLCLKNNINLITIFENEWMAIKNRNQIKLRLMEYFNQYIADCNAIKIENIDLKTCSYFLDRNRYWSQFINLTDNFKGIYNEHDVMCAVLINIKDNCYVIYKLNGVIIDNLSIKELCSKYNINLIQDNRYPLYFNNFTHYYDSLLWEYHDGWCTDIYKEYPDKNIKIRKINDCGYSLINLN